MYDLLGNVDLIEGCDGMRLIVVTNKGKLLLSDDAGQGPGIGIISANLDTVGIERECEQILIGQPSFGSREVPEKRVGRTVCCIEVERERLPVNATKGLQLANATC